MLQFVPAILLLLIQGQTGTDRLGSGNGLPATILALSTEMGNAQEQGTPSRSLASLLAMSKQNPSLSAWLIGILESLQDVPCAWAALPPGLSSQQASGDPSTYKDPPLGFPSKSLAAVSRFRDGPVLF